MYKNPCPDRLPAANPSVSAPHPIFTPLLYAFYALRVKRISPLFHSFFKKIPPSDRCSGLRIGVDLRHLSCFGKLNKNPLSNGNVFVTQQIPHEIREFAQAPFARISRQKTKTHGGVPDAVKHRTCRAKPRERKSRIRVRDKIPRLRTAA